MTSWGVAFALTALTFATACDDEHEPAAIPTTTSVATNMAEPTGGPTGAAAEPVGEPSEPVVDLLRAVPAAVAVSSVYRGREAQVARIADGDLETAWNSRSGDLVGAFVDVRLPPRFG